MDSVAEADVYVLNTCTVTATADAKARRALRAARRANPHAFIVATGCYPQRAAAELTRLEAVSLVVGNSRKDQLVSLVLAAYRGKKAPSPSWVAKAPSPNTGLGRTRTMIKIQEGCNQVCAYCIVPKVRGRERSIPPETLVQQINRDSPDQTNFPGYSSFWDTVKYNPAFQGRQIRPNSLKFPVFI